MFSLAQGGELSVRELACAADLAAPTVTQMLDHLADIGLVARVRSALDKRVVLTSLTERGQALIAERKALFEPRWSAALAEFDEVELATAAAVLARLAKMFEHFAAD
jgi:DNA-binding MarR family transcriptional regulator